MSNSLSQVTRLEIIDHSKCENCGGTGRIYIEGQVDTLECPVCHGLCMVGCQTVFWDENKEVRSELQDDGRTLKLFITRRGE